MPQSLDMHQSTMAMKSLMCAKAVLDDSDARLNVTTLNPKSLTMDSKGLNFSWKTKTTRL
ncbi:hypothetical protein HanIR_Chr01g0029041 [Helianthus annuus]|nr:hypothetical protein HanIR_Chr01g0029041 [Helianthus annuus]